MSDRVTITHLEDGIADVRMVRTDKMNALEEQKIREFNSCMDRVSALTAGFETQLASQKATAEAKMSEAQKAFELQAEKAKLENIGIGAVAMLIAAKIANKLFNPMQ